MVLGVTILEHIRLIYVVYFFKITCTYIIATVFPDSLWLPGGT